MYLIRKRSQMFLDIFPSKVTILDDYWTQVVGSRYAQAVQKKELQTFQCPDELMQYCQGERPIRGTSWMDVEMLLIPLNITNTHWVAMVIDIPSWYIYLLDSDLMANASEKMKTIVEPFVHLVPMILKKSGIFSHPLKVREYVPFQYLRLSDGVPRQVTSGECGVFTYKFLEMYMMRCKLTQFSDDHCYSVRKCLASEIFACDMDP
ncbi:hypothetical protein UlMin_023491 [Ulmus minor]